MMKDTNLLFEQSARYRTLLNRIHDNIQQENDHISNNELDLACNAGLKAWSDLKKFIRFIDAEDFLDIQHETIYDLLYWATELEINLHNVSNKNTRFFKKRMKFCQEYTNMHENILSKDMRNLGSIRRGLADCYVKLGDFESVDNLYGTWLEQEPSWGWGWIGWSDAYWLFVYKNERNFEKGKEILEKGLSITNVEDSKYIIHRLNDLNKEVVLTGV